MKRITGQYERTSVAGEDVAAFVPYPLPPVNPVLSLGGDGLNQLRQAEEGLRRLDLAAEMVPSLDWFVYGFVRKEAVDCARELFALVARDRERVLAVPQGSIMAIRLFERLPEHPMLTIANAIELLETTRPTAAKAISTLVESGVLIESFNRKRDRTFVYEGYFDLLRVGTEL